jgi:hypothetical protein
LKEYKQIIKPKKEEKKTQTYVIKKQQIKQILHNYYQIKNNINLRKIFTLRNLKKKNAIFYISNNIHFNTN